MLHMYRLSLSLDTYIGRWDRCSETTRGGLPVYVVIIEFSKPVAEVHDR